MAVHLSFCYSPFISNTKAVHWHATLLLLRNYFLSKLFVVMLPLLC